MPTLYQTLCWVLMVQRSHERMVPACADDALRVIYEWTDDRGRLSSASDQEPNTSHGDRLVFIVSWSWASYLLSLTVLTICQFTFLYTENKYLVDLWDWAFQLFVFFVLFL